MNGLTPGYGLTTAQEEYQARAVYFVKQAIQPHAAEFDKNEFIPRDLFDEMGRSGYLGINVAEEYGGESLDNVHVGLLHLAIGAGCSSLRSILTVHSMVADTVQRWGTLKQKSEWLPLLATGRTIAAFALTEAEAGSDAKGISTVAVQRERSYVLSGEKRWITGADIADLFLVFAKCAGKDTAFLLRRDTPGLAVTPIKGLLGLRGSMLGTLRLSSCEVPLDSRVGGISFGIDAVAATALDFGRYTVAWGCVGIGQACLEDSMHYASSRRQFGKALQEHQLVSAIISDMIVSVRAAGLMCMHAGRLRDLDHEAAVPETCAAKYMASKMCAKVASDTVQLHGAIGCGPEHAAQRYYRDAKIMEIIEGSNQVQQILIAKLTYDIVRQNSSKFGI